MTHYKEPLIIQLCGNTNSGKDHIGKLLSDYYTNIGKSTQILRFSQPIKDLLQVTLGCSEDKLEELKREDSQYYIGVDPEPINSIREMHIAVGEHLKEVFGRYFFVDHLMDTIEDGLHDVYIVTDLRFSHERLDKAIVIKIDDGNPKDQYHIKSDLTVDNKGKVFEDADTHRLVAKINAELELQG